MNERLSQSVWVKAGNEWVDFRLVEFIDIEEESFGDVVTFEFEGVEYKSVVVRGSRPG